MKIVKETVLNLHQVCTDFLTYDESFRKIRPEIKECFICGNKFELGDNLNIGFIVGHTNVILCDTCCKQIAEDESVKIVAIKKKV